MSFVFSCDRQPEAPNKETSRTLMEDVSMRNTMLHRVGVNAEVWWGSLSDEWKVDKEFVLKALTESPYLPPKWDFEGRFSLSLRNDRDVVLAFANRLPFLNLFVERHLGSPDGFTGDKEIMLAYCTWIPGSLQDCSFGEFKAVLWIIFCSRICLLGLLMWKCDAILLLSMFVVARRTQG